MESIARKFIWRCTIAIAVLMALIILGSAASQGTLFQSTTFLAAMIWGGGVLVVGGFFSSFFK